jgi:hypothetical protein
MKRAEMEAMTKDEYYNSPQHTLLQFFHNGAHNVQREAQELRKMLHLIAAEFELGCWGDKYNLVQMQIKLMMAEARHLTDLVSNLTSSLEPHKWSDWDKGPLDSKVNITVNGKVFSTSAGEGTVADVLNAVGETIDSHNLFVEQGKDERMFMIPFDCPVTIRGNEVFHTQVKGGSSG